MTPSPEIDLGMGDKINHIFAFFTLSLLLNRSSSSYEKRIRNVIALISFGIFIEIAQAFVSYRSSSFTDIIADAIGIALFQLLYSLYRYVRYKV
jgi:VanZ family protein